MLPFDTPVAQHSSAIDKIGRDLFRCYVPTIYWKACRFVGHILYGRLSENEQSLIFIRSRPMP